jgi:multisubunit Na+/H+ antiporter MnhG subunit
VAYGFNLKQYAPLRATNSVHKFSLYGGLGLMLAWFAYAIYLVVTSFVLPDSGDALDIVGVAVFMFIVGWTATHLAHRATRRIHARIFTGPRQ